MANYTVKLTGRQEIASETMAFHFKKPEGFTYKAGQWGDFTLLDPPETDDEGSTRGFSFPQPLRSNITVATRGAQHRVQTGLEKTIELGSELTMDAPGGSFALHDDARIPAVFLSGGIGITPVRSIVLQATHDHLPHKILLFDSNRRPEDAAFLDEFTDAQKKNPNFTLVATMTEIEKSAKAWNAETAASLPRPCSGNPSMISAFRSTISRVRRRWWLRCARFSTSRASRTARSAPSNSRAIETAA